MAREEGWTLMELLLVLALMTALLGLSIPGLQAIRLNAKRAATMEGLLRATWYARSEAIRRNQAVLLCPGGVEPACASSGASWSDGWVIAPADTTDENLRQGDSIGKFPAVLIANRRVFRFEPHDRRSTNGTLAWCDRRGNQAARALIISTTGRPRIETGTGSLECPL